MSKQTSTLPLAPHQPGIWQLLAEIVVPAAGMAALLALVAISLPVVNIFEIGLIAALAILARAAWHSRKAALKQAKFGAQAFVIAGLLSVVPAHAVAVFMGGAGLFEPVVWQFSLVELSLYSSLVFSVLLTFYYWVIFIIWDRQYQSGPGHVLLTVFSASLLLVAAQVALELVSNSALASLFSLAIFVLMFLPPVFWVAELAREDEA